jgi:hypothetical protein
MRRSRLGFSPVPSAAHRWRGFVGPTKCISDDMSEQDKKLRFEGIVRASGYDASGQGKQFLGATIECSDGKERVIDYDEQSPFHAFADRQVVVFGEAYKPDGQCICSTGGHFRVSAMRLVDVTPDAAILEVGAGQPFSGRFKRGTSNGGEPTLSFVTEKGDTFQVANDPAGVTAGRNMQVWAYPVELSPSSPRPSGQYLWIICPYSTADLWAWRERCRAT